MLGLWHFRNASGRVILLILLALGVRYVGQYVILWAFEQEDQVNPMPNVVVAPSVGDRVQDVVLSTTVQKVDPGGGGPLMEPLAAAALFGGLVLAVGGAGAVMLWRRAESDEAT
jgi:hypothetical protein